MLYHIFYPLSDYFFGFNVFRYVTFRAGGAFFISFFIVLALWPWTIKRLKRLRVEEKIDMYGHLRLEKIYEPKKGVPTMGGVLIIFAVVISTLLWARIDNSFVWYSFLCFMLLGALGAVDDFLKIKKGKGLSRKEKLLGQIVVGVIVGIIVCMNKNISTTVDVPFLKRFVLDLGYFYIFWSALLIVASSNAVNFADGLDGLAIGGVIINCFLFAVLSYITGHATFANYLFIPYVNGAEELAVFCASISGAGLGFLWFNSHPAQVFMGDVGALSLGGALGVVALFIKKEFLLIISGGIFVLEAVSVISQILSVKIRGKKIFKAAPIHHHFQLSGWPESKIIIRFWIISIILAVISLLTLKLR